MTQNRSVVGLTYTHETTPMPRTTPFSLPLHCLRVGSMEGPKLLSVSCRVLLEHRLDLLEEQAGRKLLTFEVSVYGVVAEALEMIGHVGQGVVDLAAQQVLAVVQFRKAHVSSVADFLSA